MELIFWALVVVFLGAVFFLMWERSAKHEEETRLREQKRRADLELQRLHERPRRQLGANPTPAPVVVPPKTTVKRVRRKPVDYQKSPPPAPSPSDGIDLLTGVAVGLAVSAVVDAVTDDRPTPDSGPSFESGGGGDFGGGGADASWSDNTN